MAIRLWKFLTTDIRELNWKQTEEVTKTGVDAAKAVFDLAKTLNEQGNKAQNLQPYVVQIASLLDVLNAPLAQVATSVIPFAPLAVSLIKLITELTKRELSLVQCVALVSQVAYLESLQAILKDNADLLNRIGVRPVSDAVAQQIKQLGDLELNDRQARIALLYFHESELATHFNQALQKRLEQAGLDTTEAANLTDLVARKTDEFMIPALTQAGESVKRLVDWYQMGGRDALEKYISLEEYLVREIQSKPEEPVFDEKNLTFREIYVRVKAQPLDRNGQPLKDSEPVDLETWVETRLNQMEKPPILFIQGEAGRGKSVFCRMFGDRICRERHPSFTPILIRLRYLNVLENNLTKTLSTFLEHWDFVTNDSGWLTAKQTRFLFLLDGFDELVLEGRTSGGLKEFLQQVEAFQRHSHHRFVVTGRPLALQGIERVIGQSDDLERIEICPMDDHTCQRWDEQWAKCFGAEMVEGFSTFLQSCPEDVSELAREPLLRYLLARMHRENRLNGQMFVNTTESQAKLQIYDEAIKWVLEKQRDKENFRLTGLEMEDLRRFLMEVALCAVQSGKEYVTLPAVQTRLENSPVTTLLEKTQKQTNPNAHPQENPDRLLNNLLTAFYIQPAAGDRGGAVEFVHKSFGEFLFAERLKEAMEDWSKAGDRRRGGFLVDDKTLDWELYDLLGYGGLTPDIVGYLMAMLTENQKTESQKTESQKITTEGWIRLFQRLERFYDRWGEGEFIDAPPENLPQQKIRHLREQQPDQETPPGLRQVDVYTGLNAMILLLALHRYAQGQDDLKESIIFYPNGQPLVGATELQRTERLLPIIHYSDCLGWGTFTHIAGPFLASANLDSAHLDSANLTRANLDSANLTRANLDSANLDSANLASANLDSADLYSANLASANLASANLTNANLISAYLYSADLYNADLTRANLTRADLYRADLTSANLTSANLTRADLISADLTSADLTRANLTSANLYRANLYRADLTSANLDSATLYSANLSYANLTNADLSNITWNDETHWEGLEGWETATNVPEALKRQLGLG